MARAAKFLLIDSALQPPRFERDKRSVSNRFAGGRMWQDLRARVPRTLGSVAFAAILAIVGIVTTPRTCDAQSQADCVTTPHDISTPPPIGFVMATPATCRDVSDNLVDNDLTGGGW